MQDAVFHDQVTKDTTDVVLAWAAGLELDDKYLDMMLKQMDHSDTMWVLGNWLAYCAASEDRGQETSVQLFCVGLLNMDQNL